MIGLQRRRAIKRVTGGEQTNLLLALSEERRSERGKAKYEKSGVRTRRDRKKLLAVGEVRLNVQGCPAISGA